MSRRSPIATDPDCRTQLRISVEARTNAYQVRMGDYPEEPLSVYVTARQYGSLSPDKTLSRRSTGFVSCATTRSTVT